MNARFALHKTTQYIQMQNQNAQNKSNDIKQMKRQFRSTAFEVMNNVIYTKQRTCTAYMYVSIIYLYSTA